MKPLWTPSRAQVDGATLTHFMNYVRDKTGVSFADYASFYAWSVDQDETFWSLFWDFSQIKAEKKGERIYKSDPLFEKCRFFPDAFLNYAQNILQTQGVQEALIFWQEDGFCARVSFDELNQEVSRFAQALKSAGVKKGDRVAALVPNRPEAIIAMLATVSLGAIWSSCSPDFGAAGVLDRFGQVEPKILLGCEGFVYKGVYFDCQDKIATLQKELSDVVQTVIIPNGGKESWISKASGVISYPDFIGPFEPKALEFTQVPFDHPLMILFSSGTTGKPKCIVHGHGGTLLQHFKEHRLHCDIKPGDKLFYFTTTSWMMWNWLVSGLGSGATLLLFDGSPFHPTPKVLFDYIQKEKCTHFGVSAKYIDALHKAQMSPKKTHDLSCLRMILSTGSPLVPESFDYVYQEIADQVCLASISGGTDIVSCFALGNPVMPVWRGELQTRGLGLAVDVFDAKGNPVRGEKGELVCKKPFPCMPIGFWRDETGERFHRSYFEHFQGCWRHGDFVELTNHDGIVIHGRSDTVLNPGGVRIGTAEIYRQVEQLSEVLESLVVAQQWEGDVRVVLFVKLQDGQKLSEELRTKIRFQIRQNATPRHVPTKIIQVPDIPRTGSGKIVEMAVTDVIHGRVVANKDALANPESLDFYKNLKELAQ